MNFRISALAADQFSELFELDDAQLTERGARRMTANVKPGFPCRVSLRDAEIGETVALVNYEHLSVRSPYRSSHAVFVRQGAVEARPDVGEIPESLRLRVLSLRAFDENGMMVDADIVHGREVEPALQRLLGCDSVDFVHIHNAKPGCYAACARRV